MEYHTGSPCSRDAYSKQADNLQQCPEDGFSAGAVTTVHDIVAGADGSGCQIDQDHIFPVKCCVCTKPEQRKHRSVQEQSGKADTERDRRAQQGEFFHILISAHEMAGTDFFSYHHGGRVCETAEESEYEALQYTERSHGGDSRL